jgi:hypothetical protein
VLTEHVGQVVQRLQIATALVSHCFSLLKKLLSGPGPKRSPAEAGEHKNPASAAGHTAHP